MDPFAQSREDDDLFADEFEPVADAETDVAQSHGPVPNKPGPGSAQLRPNKPSSNARPKPNPSSSSNNAGPTQPNSNRGGRREGQERRQRGGRGAGGAGPNGLSASRYATQPQESNAAAISLSTSEAQTSTVSLTNTIADIDTTTPTNSAQSAPPPTAPIGPSVETQRTPAVRGDRSATGGPAHKKLTEEELTAKLAQMAILNAQKAERHRLSEADQAAFQHREKEQAKERKEKAVAEKKNERMMEMERAKNRERKMKAQGGREWDSEKLESDIVDRKGRSSEYVRGGHGGVIKGGLAGSRYSTADGEEQIQGPKRGGAPERGRGGRGARGGGRGGKASLPSVPAPEEFPALAPANVQAPAGDWAEEMATPVEEKKMAV